MKTPVPQHAKHALGQNFLVDGNVLDKIVSFFHPSAEDHVIEIGAGTGALTSRLAGRVERLVAVEVDSMLIPILQSIPGVEILHSDILKLDLAGCKKDRPLRVIGNLPYYISTATVSHLLKHRDSLQDLVLMFQREVAHRLTSAPSHHEYGFISAVAQYFCVIESGFRISSGCFRPRPQVESQVLRFRFRRDLPLSYEEYTRFVGYAFAQRRKKLRNNLLRVAGLDQKRLDASMSRLGIAETARAENLSPDLFEALILELR